jgi:hypothetical protein
MLALPPPLRSGDPIQTIVPWAAKVIDYLRAITPRPSATVAIKTTANGTTLHAASPSRTVRATSAEFPYGFLVHVEKVKVNNVEKDHVKVALGTAKAWGGEVKVYEAADLGEAKDGYFVYAVLHLPFYWDDVPYWDNALHFDEMEDQDAEMETWVPIAYVENLAEDPPEPETGEDPPEPTPIWVVTQLHWGNIVIPATVNAVDVQENPIPASQQSQQPSA